MSRRSVVKRVEVLKDMVAAAQEALIEDDSPENRRILQAAKNALAVARADQAVESWIDRTLTEVRAKESEPDDRYEPLNFESDRYELDDMQRAFDPTRFEKDDQ